MGLLGKLFGKKSNEEIHASNFIKSSYTYIKNNKYTLSDKPSIKKVIAGDEFDYWATLVALRAADSGAIIKYGIDAPFTKKLLHLMISEFQKINPHVSKNLQYNQMFIKDIEVHGRLGNEIKSIPEAHGFWILYSLGIESLDYKDSGNKEVAKIIGDWLFNKYITYWDKIPNYT